MINLENKKTVQEIVNICIDKEINISINTTLKMVNVWTEGKEFYSYYSGPDFRNTNKRLTLPDLLEKVKSM